MNRLFPPVTLLAFCLCTGATAQTAAKTSATPSPKTAPAVVTPAPGDVLIPAPSDAQILFDGKDLAQWCRKDGSPAAWTVENGDMVVKAKSGNIQTKRNFGDCQLHIEWCTPENVSDTGQLRSNSGVFLQSLYEVQILDSYLNDTYWNGQAGSIYKQYAPLVNATKAPGQWNVYDIIYTAPAFQRRRFAAVGRPDHRPAKRRSGPEQHHDQRHDFPRTSRLHRTRRCSDHAAGPRQCRPLPQHLDPGTVAPEQG